MLSGDRERLQKIAELAPGRAFAEALLLVEETDRNMYRSYGNKRMQLDALLLAFNEIARPIVLARPPRPAHGTVGEGNAGVHTGTARRRRAKRGEPTEKKRGSQPILVT